MPSKKRRGKIGAIASACAIITCSACQTTDEASERQGIHEVFGSARHGTPVPVSVSEVAWKWNSPEEDPVFEVIPVPTGAVAHTSSGAFAIDTLTGETLWSYGFSESTDDVEPTPDGSRVVVSSEQGIAVLDAASGKIIVEEHEKREEYELSLESLGIPLNSGLVSMSEENGQGLLTMDPWEGSGEPWEAEASCSDGGPAGEVRQALTTPTAFIVVQDCADGDQEVVSFSPESGEELWRSSRDEDLGVSTDLDLAGTGEVLVHQDISTLRGTLIVDASTGEVIADDLEDSLDNDLLRVLPDGYLAVREDRDGNLSYELREFSGKVIERTLVDREEAGSAITGYLPLSGALVKLSPTGEGNDVLQPVVHGWGTEHGGERITVPFEVVAPETLSLREVDRVLGPGAFEAVPGAVILREHSSDGTTAALVGLH